MALLFYDGFDCYAAVADLNPGRWTGINTSGMSLVAGHNSGSQGLKFTNTTGFAAVNFTTATTIVVGCYINIAAAPSGVVGIFNFFDSTRTYPGGSQCAVGVDTSLHAVMFRAQAAGGGNMTANTVATSSSTISTSTWHYLEAKLTFNGSSSTYDIHLDGVSILSGTGNIQATANANAGELQLCAWGNALTFTADDLYLCDGTGSSPTNTFLGDMRVETLHPTGDASKTFSVTTTSPGQPTGSSAVSVSSGLITFSPFTTFAGTLNSITFTPNATSAGINVKGALYSDNSGVPGTPLATTSVVTGVTGGTPVTLSFSSPPSVSGGTQYWVAFITDTSLQWNEAFIASARTVSSTYPTFPTNPTTTLGSFTPNWTSSLTPAGNWVAVSEAQEDGDTSHVDSSTVGAEDLYTLPNLSNSPTTIFAAQVLSFEKKMDANACTYTNQIKTGSTDTSGATQTATTSYEFFADFWTTNPSTSVAWTYSGIGGAKIGMKIVTSPSATTLRISQVALEVLRSSAGGAAPTYDSTKMLLVFP